MLQASEAMQSAIHAHAEAAKARGTRTRSSGCSWRHDCHASAPAPNKRKNTRHPADDGKGATRRKAAALATTTRCAPVAGRMSDIEFLWRARHDSNVRPLPSEGSTLIQLSYGRVCTGF